jgi:hypothetical protein
MISKSKQYIFVANMKTGSQSVSNTLSKYSDSEDDKHYTAMELKNGVFTSPASINCSKHNKHISEIKENWNKYFTFAFIRNPYDHFLSLYFYVTKYGDYSIKHNNISFEDFAKDQLNTNFSVLSNWNFTGLFDRISDEDDNIIVDFVGRMENMEEDWKKISEKIGVNDELLFINKSNRDRNYKKYYNDDIKKIVEKFYEKDIERFGYTF